MNRRLYGSAIISTGFKFATQEKENANLKKKIMMPLFSIMPNLPPRQFLQGKKSTFIPGNDTLWLVFDSTDQGLGQFYQFADFLKRLWNITDTQFASMYTALSEAVLNAVNHGNKWEKGKSVYVNANRYDGYYTFCIEDEGDGFNYHRIENPTDKENRMKAGGRGIFIMNYLSTDVHFSENGRMVKLLFSGT
jgi:serine/threonine-protein kinase RsbW